ncbi:hypothetical protein [Saccharothrix syringae]|uniref:Uncharacterized protein n=1 Tax=Saccharothrix syringae TaxID=103733 RepID=A0A5Q0GXN9_SACSY|nr:hypothetical protein [Saccharothrix syringae]QFZ18663.1 hypothetical protein EKG83_15385 [Saccharothrix syringae]
MTDPRTPRRPRYREGQVLRAETLNTEQHYRVEMRRRHEEVVHDGSGHEEEELPAGGGRVGAATVAAPAGVELRLATGGPHPLFAVDFRDEDPPPVRALEIARDGTCLARDAVSATEVAPAVLVSAAPTGAPRGPRPWQWYQVLSGEAAQTRIELEPPLLPGALDRSRFVVGTAGRANRTVPLLTVDAGGTTTVRGRLQVNGPVVHDRSGGPPTGAGPALVVSGAIGPKADGSGGLATFWVSNVGPQVVAELVVVLVIGPSEFRPVGVPGFLAPGAYAQGGVAVPGEVDAATVIAVGLLLGGRLCHARSVVRKPKAG